jgi:hypothetical protein
VPRPSTALSAYLPAALLCPSSAPAEGRLGVPSARCRWLHERLRRHRLPRRSGPFPVGGLLEALHSSSASRRGLRRVISVPRRRRKSSLRRRKRSERRRKSCLLCLNAIFRLLWQLVRRT